MITNTLLLSAAFVLTGMSQSSAATKFFDNYPDNPDDAWFVCETQTCGANLSPAVQFFSSATGTTVKVTVPISGHVQVLLRADNNSVPGKVLEKKQVSARKLSTTIKMSVSLTSGTPYWLEVAPETGARTIWLSSESTNTCNAAEPNGTGWSVFESDTCPAAKIVGTADK